MATNPSHRPRAGRASRCVGSRGRPATRLSGFSAPPTIQLRPPLGSTCSSSRSPTAGSPRSPAGSGRSTTTAVLHLSGSQGLEVLAPHAARGSMHPRRPAPESRRSAPSVCSQAPPSLSPATRSPRELAQSLRRTDRRRPRREPRGVPRGRLHRGEPRRRPDGPGREGRQGDRARSRRLPRPVPGRSRRRRGPRTRQRRSPGPASRGDSATLARHRAALAPEESAGYDAGVALGDSCSPPDRQAASEVA